MADIPFAFLIGGEQLDPTRTRNPEQAEQVEQIVAAITDRVEGLLCPEHNEPPRFLCSGERLAELSLQIHGCCDELVEMAARCLTPP